MAYWKQKYRKINGERRLVKVRKTPKGEQVRVVGNRNYTDKNAKYPRKKYYYSSTDKRKSRPIGRRSV